MIAVTDRRVVDYVTMDRVCVRVSSIRFDLEIKPSLSWRLFPRASSVHFRPGSTYGVMSPTAAGGPWPRDATGRDVSPLGRSSACLSTCEGIAQRGPTWRECRRRGAGMQQTRWHPKMAVAGLAGSGGLFSRYFYSADVRACVYYSAYISRTCKHGRQITRITPQFVVTPCYQRPFCAGLVAGLRISCGVINPASFHRRTLRFESRPASKSLRPWKMRPVSRDRWRPSTQDQELQGLDLSQHGEEGYIFI